MSRFKRFLADFKLKFILIFSALFLFSNAYATPLIDAVKNCQSDTIKTMLANGSGGNVNAADEYGFTALMWGIQRCDVGTVQVLVGASGALPKDTPQFVSIIEAAKGGHNDTIAYLLSQGYKVNHKDHFGKTALMWACGSGRLDTVKLLLSTASANVNIQDSSGQTALMVAAQHGNMAILNELLAKKPNIELDAKDKFGYTALIWAAHHCKGPVVQALLTAGADKTVKGSDHSTALSVAQRRGCADAVQALQ